MLFDSCCNIVVSKQFQSNKRQVVIYNSSSSTIFKADVTELIKDFSRLNAWNKLLKICGCNRELNSCAYSPDVGIVDTKNGFKIKMHGFSDFFNYASLRLNTKKLPISHNFHFLTLHIQRNWRFRFRFEQLITHSLLFGTIINDFTKANPIFSFVEQNLTAIHFV